MKDFQGRIYYAYCVEVQRSDAEDHETKMWTIVRLVTVHSVIITVSVFRRYGEFYALESKLMEFHADSLTFATLPQKKVYGREGSSVSNSDSATCKVLQNTKRTQILSKCETKLPRTDEKRQIMDPSCL